MKNNLYLIQDSVLQESGPIFEAKNDAVAIRQYKHLLEKSSNKADFHLLCVGSIDHNNNNIIIDPTIVIPIDWEQNILQLKGVVNGVK